jgi:anaerobic selenocysteine-containing dehydrogenase
LFAVDYDSQNPINEGSLCPRGNSVAELVDHPQRLDCPRVDGQEVDWSRALTRVAQGLKDVIKTHGPEAVAILAGGGLGLEEAVGVDRLAHDVLKTPLVAPLFPDDGAVFSRLARLGWDTGFSVADLEERQAILLIGDVFSEHPVISKRILKAKYKDRSHQLFVLDSVPTQTTWFAHQHLQPSAGTEALVLMAVVQLASGGKGSAKEPPLKLDLEAVAKRTGVSVKQMETVASALRGASDGAIVQSNLFGRQSHTGLCALLGHGLSRLMNGRFVFLHLPVYGNGRGVYQMLAAQGPKAITGPGILERIEQGTIKAAVLFGVDPLSAVPSQELEDALGRLDLLCDIEPLPTMTTPLAQVILPGAIGPEKSCRWLYLNGDIQDNPQAVPPPGLAQPEGWIVSQLAEYIAMGQGLAVDSAEVERRLAGVPTHSWSELLKEERKRLDQELDTDESVDVAYPLFLVLAALPAHLGDGSVTRHLRWAKKVAGEPCLWASATLMRELGVGENDRVQVSSKTHRAIFPILLKEDLPDNVVVAPGHFPEVRRLFSRKIDISTGELDPGSERVSISRPTEP